MAVREVDPADKRELNRFIRLERELVARPAAVHGDSRLQRAQVPVPASRSSRRRWDIRAVRQRAGPRRRDREPAVAALAGRAADRRIGWFAAAPDSVAEAREVLDAAEDWLGRRGMTRVIAPFNGVAFLGMARAHRRVRREPDVPDAVDAALLRAVPRGCRICTRTYPFWFYEVDFDYERYREFTRRALRVT